jgi:hypothetical protein
LHKALTAPQLFAQFCLAAKRFISETLFVANQVMSNALSGSDHWHLGCLFLWLPASLSAFVLFPPPPLINLIQILVQRQFSCPNVRDHDEGHPVLGVSQMNGRPLSL